MAQYAVLIYAGNSAHAPEATAADTESCDEHADELETAGSMLVAYALTPRDMATSVRADGVSGGPFIDGREIVAGFYVIEAPDRDAALAIAGTNPAIREGGGVEVRPVHSGGVVERTTGRNARSARLRCGIVVRVHEDHCEVLVEGRRSTVRYAKSFPSPRLERVSPGNLVALATAADGSEAVVWRWFDAVVLGEEGDFVRLWEPAHGEVAARARRPQAPRRQGTRAYLSGGLPGADWWVAGAITDVAEDADVELDEVERFCTEHDLWNQLS